jgi:hypothetical protein
MPEKSSEEKKLGVAKEELKIVREFLRRNNIDEMCAALKLIGEELHGAKVTAGSHPVPVEQKPAIPFQNVEWDSDGFFDSNEPTRATVPVGLGGKYFVQVAVRWHNPEEVVPPPPIPLDIQDSYYYAFVSRNGSEHAVGPEARPTANKVANGATGTTQHFTFDLDLDGGDFIEVKLYQGFYDPVRADVVLSIRRVGG